MRKADVRRKTQETDIELDIALDGSGEYSADTSIPFLDHMLALMARHGLIDLKIKARGDIEIDYHHLIEDTGITFGQAFHKAVGDRVGIKRYGHAVVPMDETLAEVVIDISGRPFLVYEVAQREGRIKDIDVSLFEDFFRAFSNHAMVTLHIVVRYGRDLHHIYEAIFKALGRAIDDATTKDERIKGLPTTKGMF